MGDKETGLAILRNYDKTLGGTGIYQIRDKKLLGVYRALSYVWIPLQGDNPENFTRSMIHSACCYLEELLKKIVRISPWEQIKADSLPLGTLVNRARKHLPLSIYDELDWLARDVYNFAKHHYNLEDDDLPEPDHYFGLDEAIAVYLIVRKLGLELEGMIPLSKRVDL